MQASDGALASQASLRGWPSVSHSSSVHGKEMSLKVQWERKHKTDAELGDQADSEDCSVSATTAAFRDHQLPLLSPFLHKLQGESGWL